MGLFIIAGTGLGSRVPGAGLTDWLLDCSAPTRGHGNTVSAADAMGKLAGCLPDLLDPVVVRIVHARKSWSVVLIRGKSRARRRLGGRGGASWED